MGDMSRCIEPLKEDTTKPPALTLRLQQKKLDGFRKMFNQRPHEGLNNKTPGSIYQPSSMIATACLDRLCLP
jgi:hypothetical protein